MSQFHAIADSERTVRAGAPAAVGLLPTYTGTAVYDGYASFFTHAGCTHAVCGVHLLRELTFLARSSPTGAPAPGGPPRSCAPCAR